MTENTSIGSKKRLLIGGLILVGVVIAATAAWRHFAGDGPAPQDHRPGLILLASDRRAYGRLCRLLTTGRRRVGKGGFVLSIEDVAQYAEGLQAIHVGPHDATQLAREKDLFGDRLSLSIERNLTPFDRTRIEAAVSASAPPSFS